MLGLSDSAFTKPPLLVSTLSVNVESKPKEVGTVILNAGIIKKEIPLVGSPGASHQAQFNPPLEIPLHTRILVSVPSRNVAIFLDPETASRETDWQDVNKVYRKTEKNVEVTIGFRSLPPTINEIVASCSRFRVLIIGKSGVGKSTLINKVFGVHRVDVSNTTRGKATIDQEHIAAENEHFIVHDSLGFEAADHGNLDVARKFITDRRCRKDIKDKLHAVWLCLEIPFAGGRVLETGVEEFLRERVKILGNTPLVVVFTKLDSLVNMLCAQSLQAGILPDEATLEKQKAKELERNCFGPIRGAVGNDVPFVAVSTEEGYEGSLSELMEKTTASIKKHLRNEATLYIATIAQRVSITLKLEAIIRLGEKRYWNMLKESPDFEGQPVKACLDVLHKDIVSVWNFKDPYNSLHAEEFKEALLKTLKGTQGTQLSAQGSSVIAALVTITGGTTLFTAITATGARIRCKLAQARYEADQNIVRQLMAYIVDLTCVMQILLLLIAAKDNVASAEKVLDALAGYRQTYGPNVHGEIDAFPVKFGLRLKKEDEVLDKIKELICKYRLPDEDVVRFRREAQPT